ncbi:MAG: hypothetical protein JWO06_3537 [Bacteroidota bacterium]|nr:hypothetical protein [Bacteroidota bacterium]
MKTLQTEVVINASPDKVWSILTDFAKFPEWNPFVLKVEGKPEIDVTLRVELNNGKGISVFKPKVLVVEKNRAFEWLGSLPIPGLFNGHHYFRIETITANQVKFVHGEEFTGLLAGLIMKQIGEQTQKGFIAMNRALKGRAES